MSKIDKRKERLKNKPKDYTYDEAKALLECLGFQEVTKGKTSGSRVMFYRERDSSSILLHKPHPDKTMKSYAVDELCDHLREIGEIT